jgi:hypothetical protein
MSVTKQFILTRDNLGPERLIDVSLIWRSSQTSPQQLVRVFDADD